MENIKLKLIQSEVVALGSYLSGLPNSFDLDILVLIEFRDKFWKRALAHRISGKSLFVYVFPASVMVALWQRWQKETIDTAMQLTLAQIDSVLTNRGIK